MYGGEFQFIHESILCNTNLNFIAYSSILSSRLAFEAGLAGCQIIQQNCF